jgi:hypothetical protein
MPLSHYRTATNLSMLSQNSYPSFCQPPYDIKSK